MDFGAGAVSQKRTCPNAAAEEKAHGYGSEHLKHQRSGLGDDDWGLPKMPKPGGTDFSSKMTMMTSGESFSTFGRSNLWPDDGQKMLSFSSSEPGGGGSSRNITFSLAQDEPDKSIIRGPFARMRGPFTPSQWTELEHQALIYKHLVANVSVPPHLLIPLRRSLPAYASPAYTPNFFGWGSAFQVGYSRSSNDPEPGRCRRTDGKKWRCSRDAVPDQKYCERHINRGRHRSRKPVEGQTGHAVAGSTSSEVAPIAPASSSAASVMPSGSGAPNTLTAVQQHLSSMQQQPNNAAAPCASTNNLVSRSQGFRGLSLLPPQTTGLKSSNASPFSAPKQQLPFEEPSISEFGFILSDALLNPSERIPYIDNCNSGSFMQFDSKEANNQQPIHQFIDDWPKDQSQRPSAPWPEELKSDWTQLSMSIPAPDFSSSPTSPAQQKSTISIPRLSHDLDHPIHMSLGTSHDLGGPIHRQPSWLPVTWGNPMGGPLGEVLISSTTGAELGENLSAMKATWKNNSPQMESSPSGVLHKSNFVSLSNSSSASSPPSADDKSVAEKARLCNEFLGAALANPAAISLE